MLSVDQRNGFKGVDRILSALIQSENESILLEKSYLQGRVEAVSYAEVELSMCRPDTSSSYASSSYTWKINPSNFRCFSFYKIF